jgi:hypothetical protein
MADLRALIAKAKAEIAEAEPSVVPVNLGGELVDIAFGRMTGAAWADLTASCAPRKGSVHDANIGWNTDAVARKYPLDSVLIDGQPVVNDEGEFDAELWNEVIDALPSVSIRAIAAELYRVNQKEPLERIIELGKAQISAPKKRRR